MEKKIQEKKERERLNHLRHLPYCTTFAEKKKLFKKKIIGHTLALVSTTGLVQFLKIRIL